MSKAELIFAIVAVLIVTFYIGYRLGRWQYISELDARGIMRVKVVEGTVDPLFYFKSYENH